MRLFQKKIDLSKIANNPEEIWDFIMYTDKYKNIYSKDSKDDQKIRRDKLYEFFLQNKNLAKKLILNLLEKKVKIDPYGINDTYEMSKCRDLMNFLNGKGEFVSFDDIAKKAIEMGKLKQLILREESFGSFEPDKEFDGSNSFKYIKRYYEKADSETKEKINNLSIRDFGKKFSELDYNRDSKLFGCVRLSNKDKFLDLCMDNRDICEFTTCERCKNCGHETAKSSAFICNATDKVVGNFSQIHMLGCSKFEWNGMPILKKVKERLPKESMLFKEDITTTNLPFSKLAYIFGKGVDFDYDLFKDKKRREQYTKDIGKYQEVINKCGKIDNARIFIGDKETLKDRQFYLYISDEGMTNTGYVTDHPKQIKTAIKQANIRHKPDTLYNQLVGISIFNFSDADKIVEELPKLYKKGKVKIDKNIIVVW